MPWVLVCGSGASSGAVCVCVCGATALTVSQSHSSCESHQEDLLVRDFSFCPVTPPKRPCRIRIAYVGFEWPIQDSNSLLKGLSREIGYLSLFELTMMLWDTQKVKTHATALVKSSRGLHSVGAKQLSV